ncbi:MULTISPECIES: TniQ family protein [unclassified Amycolatopsis]|uniref:TniQ family protein n=1 Tax=unclassified Amycolatopsis TaxID=2618356 RepID=UPI00106DFD23|nr:MULTISPECIES: TniQ family protein [unclassified Amycolatopsis]
MNHAITTLPLRVPVLAGESLDSWLHALAQRHNSSPGQLLAALGLGRGQRWIRHLLDEPDPRLLQRLEHAAGLPAGRLQTTLGAGIGPAATAPRLPSHGSRFCPSCLAESGGRWLLSWRLRWSTVCLRHERLLADCCPECGAVARRTLAGGITAAPATACPAMPVRSRRCGGDFAATLTPAIPAAVADAQRWIDRVVAAARTADGDPAARTSAENVVGDLNYVAAWLLNLDARRLQRSVRELDPLRRAGPLPRNGRAPKIDAALAAVLLQRAHLILGDDERAGIAELASTVSGQPVSRRLPPPGGPDRQWAATSPLLANRYLRAVDADLIASDRLRTKSPTSLAAHPGADPATRARLIPQQLWPDWSGRLLPPAGHHAGLFRACIATLLLVPGARTRSMKTVAAALNPRITGTHMTTALQDLSPVGGEPVLDHVLILLCRIADHLDRDGAPIDYQRRRDLVPADPIDWPTWRDLAYSARAHPGDLRPGRRSRLLHAQRHLHHLLTGSDLDNPAQPLHFQNSSDRAQFTRFTTTLTPQLRRALHQHAETVLNDLGIDEPPTWSPPGDLAAGLTLPGIDPHTLDTDKISRLLVDEQRPAAEVADLLGVHIEHVRLALERLDLQPDEPAAALHWRRDRDAARVLTPEFFEREYVQGRRTLADLAAETGFSRAVIVRHARRTGTVLGAKGRRSIPIDTDWLRAQYRDRARSTNDIAVEMGISAATVHKALTESSIPTRPPGVGSRTEMITSLDKSVPALVRAAVEGTLHGWQRLHRFRIAMDFPTIATAASYLHIVPSTLAHQFDALKKSLGAPLLHRAGGRRPHKPTSVGEQLLLDLADPHVQQLMNAALPHAPHRPDDNTLEQARRLAAAPAKPPRTRPYPGIPVARLRMTRATLAVLADLRSHHPAEFYGHELHQRIGLHHGTLYPLLKQLHAAGWLTSRPEDEAEWLAGAPPGRGPGRRRTYYQLTPDGLRAATHELHQPRRNRKPNGNPQRNNVGNHDERPST